MINNREVVDLTPEEKKKYKKMSIEQITKEVMGRSKVCEREATLSAVWIKNGSGK